MLVKDLVGVLENHNELFINVVGEEKEYLFDYDIVPNDFQEILDRMEVINFQNDEINSFIIYANFISEFKSKDFKFFYTISASSEDQLKFLKMEKLKELDKMACDTLVID